MLCNLGLFFSTAVSPLLLLSPKSDSWPSDNNRPQHENDCTTTVSDINYILISTPTTTTCLLLIIADQQFLLLIGHFWSIFACIPKFGRCSRIMVKSDRPIDRYLLPQLETICIKVLCTLTAVQPKMVRRPSAVKAKRARVKGVGLSPPH